MEDQKQEIWCSIKEYKRINSWARGVKLRWLQKRAKEGMLLDKVEKVLHPSGKYHTYLVNITDPKDIANLVAYRAVKKHQKTRCDSSDSQEPDLLSKMFGSDDLETASPRSSRIAIFAPIYTSIDIMLRSNKYRRGFLIELEERAEKASIKPEENPCTRKNRHQISIKSGTMNYLKSLGENHGFPVSAAFVLLLTEYIQANPDMLRYAIDDVKKRKNSSTQRAVGLSEPQIDKQEQTKEGG